MPQFNRLAALAHQAAELLPASPRDGDVDTYLSWRELVWSTAMRLAQIAGPPLTRSTDSVTIPAGTVTAEELLELAGIVRPGQGTAVPAERQPVHVCEARRVRRPVGVRST